EVLDPLRLARLLDVLEEALGDVDRVDLPLRPDFLGDQPREQSGTGADVGHVHLRLEAERLDDLLALSVDLTALDLELLQETLEVRLLERIVDARANALLLNAERSGQKNDEQKSRSLHG